MPPSPGGRARRTGRRVALGLALFAGLSAAVTTAASQGLEPPPESPEGLDYQAERADSLDDDTIEVELGASGRAGSATRRTRRLRFQGEGLAGSVREGDGDPLSGTVLDARAAGGLASVGTVAPRWGAGLLLGASPDPWSFTAADRGRGAALRGRSGQGVRFERDGSIALEAMGGRFSGRQLGGARLGFGAGALGLLAARGRVQSSAAVETGSLVLEAAADGRGAWRAETRLSRGAAGGTLALRVRGGREAFVSLAEPRRSGPARILAAAWERRAGPARVALHGALWRWRAGVDGARGGLEVRWRLAQHGALALGFEEQRGVRRLPVSAGALARAGRPRQGFRGAWRGESAGLALELRHETWGGRLARHAVRTVSTARVESSPAAGVTLAVAHAAYQAKAGESLYLADAEGSRLVLRALNGRGARTRIELGVPGGGGRVRATLHLTAARLRPRSQWTLEWTRRARTGRGSRVRAGP